MARLLISFLLAFVAFGESHSLTPADIDDAVDEAMNNALISVMTAQLDAPQASRIYAMTAVAIHDSYEISQGRKGYISDEIGKADTSNLITASTRAVLKQAFTHQTIKLAKKNEATLGIAIANDIAAHFAIPSSIRFAEKGLWRIGSQTPLNPEWIHAPLLEMTSAGQFRASGPPDIGSAKFAAALDETRRLGEDLSQERLADPSITARFWMDAPGSYTPPGRWNYIALETLPDMPVDQKIDMLLALNVALYDAGIAAWDTKYHYRFWRPDTAIKTQYPGENWLPMADTPLHPEYVSGHSTFSGAAASVLTSYAGETPFCTVSKELWDLKRCFTSYEDAAKEAGMSRIYGGIHYRFSNEDGLKLGADVAGHALNRLQDKGAIANP